MVKEPAGGVWSSRIPSEKTVETLPARSRTIPSTVFGPSGRLRLSSDSAATGVQADQAFGNLLQVLSAVSGQSQASRVRALKGDERRFGETLDAEQRGGMLGVDMSEAKALELYEQDKWQFGEQVARTNYMARTQNQQHNNQGQNQTSQANVQGNNAFNQDNIQTILSILASGGKIDPSAYVGA